ncbi:MAG: hypothetical protein KL787_08875 [Taibaiella sp.]|nr:hypothetical protein [Taibaiella sp.]
MNKTIIVTIAFMAIALNAFTQNLAPSKALSLLKQPYSKVKSSLIQEGYSFVEKDDEFFIFQKGRYEVTVGLKQNVVSIISAQENVADYKKIVNAFKESGLSFTQSSDRSTSIPDQIKPTLMLRFDKKPVFTCSIVSAFNVQQTKMITINYSIYSK